MKTLLLLTTLDVAGRRNNREHAALRELAPQFDRTIVVFRRRASADKPRLAILRCGSESWQDGGVLYVAVDPALNLPEGKLRDATTARPSASRMRRLIGQMLDAGAILRDRLTISGLAAAARNALAGIDPREVSCEAFGPWAAEAARRLRAEGRLASYAYIDRDYEPGFLSSRLRQSWAKRMETHAAQSADLTFSIGHRLADRHQAATGKRPILSPTGVDLGLFAAPAQVGGPLAIAYVGEVAAWSAVDLLIEALQHPDLATARLCVRGPSLPGYRAHLNDLARRAGLGDRFDWPGDVERAQIPALLARSNLGYCLFQPTPLRSHAAPLKLLEYFAAGLPVIACPGSEAGDIVAQSRAGLLCGAETSAVTEALRAYQAAPEARRNQMAKAARAVAAARDWRPIFAEEARLLASLNSQRHVAERPPSPVGLGATL